MQALLFRNLCSGCRRRKYSFQYMNILQNRVLQKSNQSDVLLTSDARVNFYGEVNSDEDEGIVFRRAKHGKFFQKEPKLGNLFCSDIPLQSFLRLQLPNEVYKEISEDLDRFGTRIVQEINDLAWECEQNPPQLEIQDAWGRRVDNLRTCSAWKKLHDISAEEGLVAIAYEQKLSHWSRLLQMCKIYMGTASNGLYSCPLAMTDGASKTILTQINSVPDATKTLLKKAFTNLTSRDPKHFWTSGQWMTEKKGGSDVANSTETIAVPEKDFYRLYGYKWFSSATDADMAFTLGRIADGTKNSKQISGLTMFYVEMKNSEGGLNNIQMVRLKDKLGTRQLPTAELLLDGCVAHKVSDEGRGIPCISDMLNITRLHNTVSAVSLMRKMLHLSRNYSRNRVAFGRQLAQIPLHMRILSQMEVETRGSMLLVLKLSILLGKSELKIANSDEMLLLRLLLPVAKLYTAKQAVSVASEGIETFGGQGYMEDTRLPHMLRDSQILPIWEGTTNVMSMDVLRSLVKTNFENLLSLDKSITLCLEAGKENSDLRNSCAAVEKSVKYILEFIKLHPDQLDIAARDIAYSIARSYIGALLIENAALSKRETDLFTARQWCEAQELCPLLKHPDYSVYLKNDFKNVMEGYRDD